MEQKWVRESRLEERVFSFGVDEDSESDQEFLFDIDLDRTKKIQDGSLQELQQAEAMAALQRPGERDGTTKL